MKTKKKGGRYLGQGTYGCAFSPPLKCSTNTKRKTDGISKLMNETSASEEYLVNQIWEEIDPKQKFSIWSTNYCKYNSKNIKQENEINKCTIKYKVPKKERLIFYPYGGVDLYKHFYEKQPKAKDYLKIFTNFLNLLEGIQIAHSKNIVHLDIKSDNIVLDKDFNMRYIDFGFSRFTDEIDINDWDKVNVFKTTYEFWPFELYFFDNTISLEEVEKHYNGYTEETYIHRGFNEIINNNIFNMTPGGYMYDVNSSWKNITVNNYYNVLKSYDYTNMDVLFKSVDIYSLGMLIISLVNRAFQHTIVYKENEDYYTMIISKEIIINDDNKGLFSSNEIYELNKNIMNHITKPLLSLGARMTYYDPMKRNIVDYVESYKEIINSESFKKYMNPTLLHKALKDFDVFDNTDIINSPKNIEIPIINPVKKPLQIVQNPLQVVQKAKWKGGKFTRKNLRKSNR